MTDFSCLNEIFDIMQKGKYKRFLYKNGVTVIGGFRSHISKKNTSNTNFLMQQNRQIPVIIRFSGVFAPEGMSDTIRDIRGMSLRFCTDKGDFDLISHNIDFKNIMIYDIPILIKAFNKYYKNKLFDESALWKIAKDRPELLNFILRFFSDICTVKSYKNIEFYGLNTYRLINKNEEITKGSFIIKPKSDRKNIGRKEAEFYAGFEPGILTKDIKEAVSSNEKIEYKLIFKTQDKKEIMIGDIWVEKLAPENDEDLFSFQPGNLVEGIELGSEKDFLLALIYAEAARIYCK